MFFVFQFRCLCCLHAVYSLPQVEQFVPPVHHAALVGLVNEFWRDHGTDGDVVSLIEQNRKVFLHLFIKRRIELGGTKVNLLHDFKTLKNYVNTNFEAKTKQKRKNLGLLVTSNVTRGFLDLVCCTSGSLAIL